MRACLLAAIGLWIAASAARAAPPTQPSTQAATASAAARTIADVKTLEDLQNVEPIHVSKRWAVRLGLSDGGKDAGPWKLLYCLADFPSVKNTDPALPPPASELSGVMGSLGPVMFTVDDPQVLQKSLQPAAGEVMTENGLVYCAAIPTAWKGTYRIGVWTWDKRLLAERVISVDEPAPNYWQDLVGSELYPPTIRSGPYALAGPSAAYPSYEREVIWSLPRGEAQPLKGQATALPGQIPAGNGMYLEKTLGQEIPKKADRPNPLKLSIAAGCLHIDAPVEKMENPSGHHLLARWWVNGKPVPPNPPQNENYRASGPTYPAKSFSFPLTLPGHLGAKAGDKVTLQVLYCPLGFEYLRPERFRNSERPGQSPGTSWRLPLLSEPLEFVATSAMLVPSTARSSGAKVVTQLVDEQGKPLTNQSISVMPVTVGYPQVEAGGPYYADKEGKVTIDSVSPGEHQYVLRQQWPVPTFVAGGLQAKVTVKNGELPGGMPDLDIKAKVHEENGKRTVDLVITSNTDKPYELRSTDLQLVSRDYRIFPPASAVPTGGTAPAKSKGNLQLAIDWDEYLHGGLWVSRRGEDIRESIPAGPAGEGLAYYRVDVGNCYSLPFELPKLGEFQGRVIDHAGRGLAGAMVYLVSNQSLQLVNGQPGGGHWYNGRVEPFDTFKGSKAVTDKDGRFTLPVVGGDRLVIVAGDMVWLARVQTGKEQTVQLPQPGKVTISYDIDGAAKEGVFRLELMTWDMPDWRAVAGVERYVTCGNGGTLEVDGLPPGEYDVCRWIEAVRVGDIGRGGMLDRGKLKVESGKASKLEYVRTKGGPISGQVVGLKEAGAPGAFVNVRPEQATGIPFAEADWKLTFFDTLATGPDGQFKTSRIAPGTYMVTAEAYKPEARTSGSEGIFDTGIRMPNLLGKTKVVVPESGEVKPIRIELAPLSGEKATAPASQPAPTVAPSADKPASQPAGPKLVAQLVDEQGKPLTNPSIGMMPVSVGYPQSEAGGPYRADKDGKVTIESLSPGEHRYVLRQEWPLPTLVTFQVPPAGLQTKVVVKKGDLPGPRPDLDIKAKVHEENGKRTVDLVISSNTDQPYELRSTDLQLVSGDYRIFPPPSAVPAGGTAPARSKGNLQLALDWDAYVHNGLWVSRRSCEVINEEWPSTPAGEGRAYYRVDVCNCRSLPIILPKLDEFKGHVIDHAGKGVTGATVYLASNQSLELCNGKNESHPGEPSEPFNGFKTVTDRDGRFTLSGVGGDRVIVAAGEMVWLVRMQTGKEQTVQLPQPGKVAISYDIEGAAKEGVFVFRLKTWDMADWRGVVKTSWYLNCKNGGTVEIVDLTPGEYDVYRWIAPEYLRLGSLGFSSMLDRGRLKVEAGKPAKLGFVRAKGASISGLVVGLKEAGLPGAFVQVRPEQATGDPRNMDEWKLTIFDALATGPDGQFKTSRLLPGTYMVTAEAYKPVDPSQPLETGERLPDFVGKAKVVVPESGEVKPIRIEIAPLKGDQT